MTCWGRTNTFWSAANYNDLVTNFPSQLANQPILSVSRGFSAEVFCATTGASKTPVCWGSNRASQLNKAVAVYTDLATACPISGSVTTVITNSPTLEPTIQPTGSPTLEPTIQPT